MIATLEYLLSSKYLELFLLKIKNLDHRSATLQKIQKKNEKLENWVKREKN